MLRTNVFWAGLLLAISVPRFCDAASLSGFGPFKFGMTVEQALNATGDTGRLSFDGGQKSVVSAITVHGRSEVAQAMFADDILSEIKVTMSVVQTGSPASCEAHHKAMADDALEGFGLYRKDYKPSSDFSVMYEYFSKALFEDGSMVGVSTFLLPTQGQCTTIATYSAAKPTSSQPPATWPGAAPRE